jgi:hypothetical protein
MEPACRIFSNGALIMKPDTVSALLIWASVVVFAVHNIEETFGIEDWMAEKFRPAIAARYRKKPFIVACSLLWVAYAFVAALAVQSGNATVIQVFGVAFAAIVANGLFHVLAAPVLGRTPPGFWSAVILVLPLGGLLAWRVITTGRLTLQQALVTFLIGAVLQIPLAAGAIYIADFLFDLKKRSSRK